MTNGSFRRAHGVAGNVLGFHSRVRGSNPRERFVAGLAQLAEHRFRKAGVPGSTPGAGFRARGVIGNARASQVRVPGSIPGGRF